MALNIRYASEIINIIRNEMKSRLNNPTSDETKYELLRKLIYSIK